MQPGGRVVAYEIEADLADTARRNLGALDCVLVHNASGVAAELPDADIVYVNASASRPDPAWLKALRPGGRLIFPWQAPSANSGVALQVTRTERGYRTAATMEVAFIACVGAMSRASKGRADSTEVTRTRSIWLAEERAPDKSAILVYDGGWFSSDDV